MDQKPGKWTPTRRSLLAGAAALAVSGRVAAATAKTLTAGPAKAWITSATGPTTPVWAYNGAVPGPTIRVRQGETVARTFENRLEQPSTIHWHGIRIDNAMDGVAGLTQKAVPPGASFDYAFTAPDAGTYWYHPHNRTWEQLARGLYGALIVEEPDPPEVDHDAVLMIDDWRLADDGRIENSFGQMHDWSHAGRLGGWVTVNGDPAWRMGVKTRDRMRLRLINTANARIFRLGLKGLAGWVVALDGQPLHKVEPAAEIVLAPAQRADLFVDVTADADEALIYSTERGASYVIASFPIQGVSRKDRLATPSPLPPNPVPSVEGRNPDKAVTLRMEGGAMGRMTHAVLDGEQLEIRDLVRAGKAWSFNGVAGMTDTPLLAAKVGEVVHLRLVNDTRWPHGIHLHGHHFQELRKDQTFGSFRDILLIERGETRTIAFIADNPGDWMIHCHMLEHAAAGMMTWINVSS